MIDKVLIYLGAHLGYSLEQIVDQFDRVYAFEANPEFCEKLVKKFAKKPHVHIIYGAVCLQHKEQITFYISKNNGDSSSIYKPAPGYELIQTKEQITVPTINLNNFLKEHNIKHITKYISDLQGNDFTVLSSIKDFLNNSSIEEIQCEVNNNNNKSLYLNSDNREELFDNLLNKNYTKTAIGHGLLEHGQNTQNTTWPEKDVLWCIKRGKIMKKIQFGCGENPIEGWENYDREVDITKPLPFENDTVDAILAEHVLEHITIHEAWNFIEECYRILKSEGVLRLAVPCVSKIFNESDEEYYEFIKAHSWGEATKKDAIKSIVFNHGHKTIWEQSSLNSIVQCMGFKLLDKEPEIMIGTLRHYLMIGRKINDIETICVDCKK